MFITLDILPFSALFASHIHFANKAVSIFSTVVFLPAQPYPSIITKYLLKSFFAHSHSKPLLAHNTFIIYIAPFNISLIKPLIKQPSFQTCISIKTIENKSSYNIHILSEFFICISHNIRFLLQRLDEGIELFSYTDNISSSFFTIFRRI